MAKPEHIADTAAAICRHCHQPIIPALINNGWQHADGVVDCDETDANTTYAEPEHNDGGDADA